MMIYPRKMKISVSGFKSIGLILGGQYLGKNVNPLRFFCRKYASYRRAKIPHLHLSWVYTKLSGFSLIEVAFVLLIVGIAASLTFPLLTASQTLERHKVTKAHQDQIFRALAGYVLKYYCLPSPSTPELIGKQGKPCKNRQERACVGIIPYQELGLSESVARDGHSRWFTYAVAKKLTREGNENTPSMIEAAGGSEADKVGFCNVPSQGINLTSLSGVSILGESSKKDFIAVVLISHGPKGAGAFQSTTSERLHAEHPLELKNSTTDNAFFIRTSQDADPKFTHEVYWVTRNNLMAIYGKYPCQLDPKDLIFMGHIGLFGHDNASAPSRASPSPPSPPSFFKDPTKIDSTGLY